MKLKTLKNYYPFNFQSLYVYRGEFNIRLLSYVNIIIIQCRHHLFLKSQGVLITHIHVDVCIAYFEFLLKLSVIRNRNSKRIARKTLTHNSVAVSVKLH